MSAQAILEQTEKMEGSLVNQEKERIEKIFEAQQINRFNLARTTAAERIAKLKKILNWIGKNPEKIHDALYADFKKPSAETDLTEIYVVNSELKHTIAHLKGWMKPKRVKPNLAFMTTSSHIRYEPRGVCLIIAPWNFPFNLTIGPLVSAIAAGNTAMIKPSEFTPATSLMMKEMLRELFPENEVAVFEGAVEVSQALLNKPFHHIFFTGSPQVGKIVMKAAAEHLSSVTLELGGKSPVIVDETANLNDTAAKVAMGKFTNNGQICIAPDYLLVHESKKDEFLEKLEAKIKKNFGESEDDREKSDDYARIISERHHSRLKNMVEESVKLGADVRIGGKYNAEDNYIAPTVLTDVPMEAPVMRDEIFGPVLPVNTYKNLDDVINLVNSGEKPLALYIFSRKNQNIEKVLNGASSGGACVNETLMQFIHPNLPFGGVNNSGIGNSHGYFGFKAFSHEKGVLKHHTFAPLKMVAPPYTPLVKKMIELITKFF